MKDNLNESKLNSFQQTKAKNVTLEALSEADFSLVAHNAEFIERELLRNWRVLSTGTLLHADVANSG